MVEGRTPRLFVECTWGDAAIDRGLGYLKARFPDADARQIGAVGTNDYLSPTGIRMAPALELLTPLVFSRTRSAFSIPFPPLTVFCLDIAHSPLSNGLSKHFVSGGRDRVYKGGGSLGPKVESPPTIKSLVKRALSVAFVGFWSAVAPYPATGAILYDTFAPGDGFDASFAYSVDGASQFQAFRFVSSADGILDTITVALGRIGGTQAATVFNLYDGSSSTTLGPLIESFVVTNSVAPSGAVAPFTGAAVTIVSALRPRLVAGQGYWLSIAEAEPANGSLSLWMFSTFASAVRLTDAQPAANARAPAFRVEATTAITLNASDRGWYRDTGLHIPTNTNWVAGWCQDPPTRVACGATGLEFRNWFLFDLSTVSDTILSATLRLDTRNYSSTDATETYALFDVLTPPESLVSGAPSGSGIGIAIFEDLGSGITYGSRAYSAGDDFTVRNIALNADGIAAIQSAGGGQLAIGGAVTSISGTMSGDEFIFGGSDNSTPQLIIETTSTALSALISDVVALDIRAGLSRSLDAMLAAAVSALDNAQPQDDIAAVNALRAFANMVEAQRGRELSEAQAEHLAASAQRIIAVLGG